MRRELSQGRHLIDGSNCRYAATDAEQITPSVDPCTGLCIGPIDPLAAWQDFTNQQRIAGSVCDIGQAYDCVSKENTPETWLLLLVWPNLTLPPGKACSKVEWMTCRLHDTVNIL